RGGIGVPAGGKHYRASRAQTRGKFQADVGGAAEEQNAVHALRSYPAPGHGQRTHGALLVEHVDGAAGGRGDTRDVGQRQEVIRGRYRAGETGVAAQRLEAVRVAEHDVAGSLVELIGPGETGVPAVPVDEREIVHHV